MIIVSSQGRHPRDLWHHNLQKLYSSCNVCSTPLTVFTATQTTLRQLCFGEKQQPFHINKLLITVCFSSDYLLFLLQRVVLLSPLLPHAGSDDNTQSKLHISLLIYTDGFSSHLRAQRRPRRLPAPQSMISSQDLAHLDVPCSDKETYAHIYSCCFLFFFCSPDVM